MRFRDPPPLRHQDTFHQDTTPTRNVLPTSAHVDISTSSLELAWRASPRDHSRNRCNRCSTSGVRSRLATESATRTSIQGFTASAEHTSSSSATLILLPARSTRYTRQRCVPNPPPAKHGLYWDNDDRFKPSTQQARKNVCICTRRRRAPRTTSRSARSALRICDHRYAAH